MRNKMIITLGANTDCEANVQEAGNRLCAAFGPVRFSEAVYTDPIGLPDSGPFLNQIAVATTDVSREAVVQVLKDIECQLGRTPEDKQKGQVPIDIDLLCWNGQVLKPADWEREYVRLLSRSVADGSQDDERGDVNC